MDDLKISRNRRTGDTIYEGYDTSQICENGHVITRTAESWGKGNVEDYCSKCGSKTVTACKHCDQKIRGFLHGSGPSGHEEPPPNFCHTCGKPYPWMENRLQTAKELLYDDDKLSQEDREKLWDLLRYVMSDPKSDLVPAKKKLIGIKLGKATATIREALLDLLAKYFAEMSKS
jgi:hypothetical protein